MLLPTGGWSRRLEGCGESLFFLDLSPLLDRGGRRHRHRRAWATARPRRGGLRAQKVGAVEPGSWLGGDWTGGEAGHAWASVCPAREKVSVGSTRVANRPAGGTMG